MVACEISSEEGSDGASEEGVENLHDNYTCHMYDSESDPECCNALWKFWYRAVTMCFKSPTRPK